MPSNPSNLLALDVGTVRIGVALASSVVRLAHPLITLPSDKNFTESLLQIIKDEAVGTLIVGLPRGLDGQETSQTELVRQFTTVMQSKVNLPVYFQDEALTSQKAKQELEARGKPYQKHQVDALAATYILEDYLKDNEVTNV